MGRRTALTDEVMETFLNAVKLGLTYKSAAAFAGVCERTFYNWKRQAEEATSGRFLRFFQELKKAEAISKATLLKDIKESDAWQAKAWILERRFPEEFGRQLKVNTDEIPVKFTLLMPDELLEATEEEEDDFADAD